MTTPTERRITDCIDNLRDALDMPSLSREELGFLADELEGFATIVRIVVNNALPRVEAELDRMVDQLIGVPRQTLLQWHAMPSRLLPNHPEYYDDPRGREHCRYMLVPKPVRNSTRLGRYHVYVVEDDLPIALGTAKTATPATVT